MLFFVFSGTDNRGQSDEWYGETENEIDRYSAKSVLISKAGVTFNAFKTKLQIKDKRLGDKRLEALGRYLLSFVTGGPCHEYLD